MQLDDYTLYKLLGKGSFGEVFLTTKRGTTELFATKKMNRSYADSPSVRKYFTNEISILKEVNHPNIVKLDDLKQTKDHYYIIMEYCNGGSLTECLDRYKKIHGKPFSEEIVQYLMRQIVDALKYLHNRKIIHRDLKLDNILVKFNNDMDKNNANMLRSQVKIIDFGFAIHLNSKNMAFSALGSPINMDPLILKKLNKKGGANALGYDDKADIWSLGTLCYEMLIGQAVFNADSMNDLIRKVEKGSYIVPTSLSREVVSFLNGMLQYDSKLRLSANELAKHHFLTKRVSDFSPIDLGKVSKNVGGGGLKINTKRNKSIWAVFNEENEKKLINIPKNLNTIDEKAEYNKKAAPQNLRGVNNNNNYNNNNNNNNNNFNNNNYYNNNNYNKNFNNNYNNNYNNNNYNKNLNNNNLQINNFQRVKTLPNPMNTAFPNNPYNYQMNQGYPGMMSGPMGPPPMGGPFMGTVGPVGPMPSFGVPPPGVDPDNYGYGYSSGVYSGPNRFGMGPYGTGYSNGGGIYMNDEPADEGCLMF